LLLLPPFATWRNLPLTKNYVQVDQGIEPLVKR
jgi:hypothetical protein